MKKIAILLPFLLLWASCQKDNVLNNAADSFKSVHELSEAINLNTETKRLADVLQNNKFTMAAHANANFGNLSKEYAYYLSGKAPTNVSLNLLGNIYRPNSEGQLLTQHYPELATVWGTQKKFQIKTNINTIDYDLYVPKAITAKMLSDNTLNISRKGNNLNWEADAKNASTLVMLQYRLYDHIENEGNIIKDEFLFLPDNGSYNIDHLLTDPNAKSIWLMLTRGTAVDFMTQEGKINFRFQANDAHYYNIP